MTLNTIGRVAAIAFVVTAFSATSSIAQGRGGGGGMMPRYDKAAEQTISGVVREVQQHQGRMGGSGTHLALETGTGVLDVHVGPTNWLASQKYAFAAGDTLSIVGSMVKIDGKNAFLAREITKAGTAPMQLRNSDGFPLWSRRGAPSR